MQLTTIKDITSLKNFIEGMLMRRILFDWELIQTILENIRIVLKAHEKKSLYNDKKRRYQKQRRDLVDQKIEKTAFYALLNLMQLKLDHAFCPMRVW